MLVMVAVFVFPIALAYAAVCDLTSYEIPNWISLTLLAVFLVASVFGSLGFVNIGWHLAVGCRNRRGPDFSDNNAGGVVRDYRGFFCGGPRDQGEHEGRDDGVARAGDVEDFPGLRGDVQRRLVDSKERHAIPA